MITKLNTPYLSRKPVQKSRTTSYSSPRFLKYASEFLDSNISNELIDEVKVVSARSTTGIANPNKLMSIYTKLSVENWLNREFPTSSIEPEKFNFDFVASDLLDGPLVGIDVEYLRLPPATGQLKNYIARINSKILNLEIPNEVILIFIVEVPILANFLTESVQELTGYFDENFRIIVAVMAKVENSEPLGITIYSDTRGTTK